MLVLPFGPPMRRPVRGFAVPLSRYNYKNTEIVGRWEELGIRLSGD
jgi:hypothetical protein